MCGRLLCLLATDFLDLLEPFLEEVELEHSILISLLLSSYTSFEEVPFEKVSTSSWRIYGATFVSLFISGTASLAEFFFVFSPLANFLSFFITYPRWPIIESIKLWLWTWPLSLVLSPFKFWRDPCLKETFFTVLQGVKVLSWLVCVIIVWCFFAIFCVFYLFGLLLGVKSRWFSLSIALFFEDMVFFRFKFKLL